MGGDDVEASKEDESNEEVKKVTEEIVEANAVKEDEEEEEEEDKKEGDKGYTCNVCYENFVCCAAILAHKRKSGHGSFKCTSCLAYMPSITARKAHVAKTGHDSFEGTLFRVKDCRGLKKKDKKKELLEANQTTDHFVSFTVYRKHQSEFVIPLDDTPAPTFLEPTTTQPSFQEETVIRVKPNIREPVAQPFSFLPLNPFGAYNPMDPYWVAPVEQVQEER